MFPFGSQRVLWICSWYLLIFSPLSTEVKLTHLASPNLRHGGVQTWRPDRAAKDWKQVPSTLLQDLMWLVLHGTRHLLITDVMCKQTKTLWGCPQGTQRFTVSSPPSPRRRVRLALGGKQRNVRSKVESAARQMLTGPTTPAWENTARRDRDTFVIYLLMWPLFVLAMVGWACIFMEM